MPADTSSILLQLIARTATPVVMISACATLILAVNSKQADIATRLRASAMEFREATTPQERKRQLAAEIRIFLRRFYLTWVSLCSLFLSVILFILTALLILLTQRHLVSGDRPTLYLFSLGVVSMLIAVALEFGESALATRSLNTEMADIVAHAPKSR